ncbi:unnamed protein product [Symbiodinium microadriaticum]|nr:unnamed protein product [Symbiodinium microadriaticum]
MDSLPTLRPSLLPFMRQILDSALVAYLEEPSTLGRIPAITLGVVGSCELLLSAGIIAKSQALIPQSGNEGGVGSVLCVIDYDATEDAGGLKGQVRRRNRLGRLGEPAAPSLQAVSLQGAALAQARAHDRVERSACAEFRALAVLGRRLRRHSGGLGSAQTKPLRGSVKLSVTEPPCLSCLSALMHFCTQHPQLRVEARSGLESRIDLLVSTVSVFRQAILDGSLMRYGRQLALLDAQPTAQKTSQGRADVGLLELEHHHAEEQMQQEEMHTNLQQQTHLTSLEHVANSAAAGELLIFRMLTGQPKQDLWTKGLAGYNVSRTLDAYHINSAGKLHQAVAAAADTRCMGRLLLDSEHRCHKAFPVYDLMLTTLLVMLMTSLVCCGCCCGPFCHGPVKTYSLRIKSGKEAFACTGVRSGTSRFGPKEKLAAHADVRSRNLRMRSSSLLALVYATLVASAEEKLVGEFGQEVLGCRCAGGKTTHGNCGYHFHFMSNEDKPWCRTKFGCGHYSIKGNWVYCDPRGTERRRADDGKLYNALDFKKFYPKDGKEKWAAAAAYEETRIARNGKAYKASEFRDYYIDYLGEEGWLTEWTGAQEETRKANDGKFYTFDQFVEHYGKDAVWKMWDSATKRRPEL